ncbi:MAG: asparagine synthase (glutamine-hydrolyzing) [Phycisphaerae bacterium]|jgi:asparagine synthase (glutamine-hydrolysing)
MCGIAGILSLSPDAPVDPDALRFMAAQITHRGPDDEGYYVDPQRRCGLAFRRLAIIDLDTGNQPLANEDRTIWSVFNGEIYNFRGLREELSEQGHRLATRTDGEVLVHLYERDPARVCEQLAGMFAIAIWDQTRGRLLLARDRLGKKPLVYAIADRRLYFASEAKAILAVPGISPRLDPQSLHRYLLYQYVPAPHSIYVDFHKLPPGTCLQLDADRPCDSIPVPYWRVPQPPPFAGTYEDAKQQLGELLTRAVEKRLIADVPLGAFLSGGVDSSIVVALMRRLGVSPLRTFSIGFPDRRYDETAHARQVAERFQTEHHEHVVTPQAREILDTLAWHYDEPFADSSAIPTYYLSRWTRESVTVALTGDAGDECFAGYDRYRAVQLAARLDVLPRGLRRGLVRAAAWLPHGRPKTLGRRLYRFLTAMGEPAARRYLAWINIFTPEMLAAGYHPDFARQIDFDEPIAWFENLYEAAPGPPANQAVHVDFHSYLPYDLLTKVDIASMACGLECRCPLLDHEVVEFALSLPLEWRLGPGGGKRILKDWAADLLPPEILNRPKMGFGVPIGEWFRGELRDLVEETILGPHALARRVFRGEWLEGLAAAHLSGQANHEHALWALLMLELWARRWRPAGV